MSNIKFNAQYCNTNSEPMWPLYLRAHHMFNCLYSASANDANLMLPVVCSLAVILYCREDLFVLGPSRSVPIYF